MIFFSQITTALNPGCNVTACKEGIDENFANVAYIKAEGSEDVLHYLLSSVGSLTALVIRGKPGSIIEINWEKLLSTNSSERTDHAITLEPSGSLLENSYAVVLTRLFEYNDMNDDASLNSYDIHSTNWTVHEFQNFGWQEVNHIKGKDNSAVFNLTVIKSQNETMDKNDTLGTLVLTFNAYDSDGRDDVLPKMEHNENNTLFDFLLNDFKASYTQSRFAIEVVVIGSSKDRPKISETESLDDEYTPGVFKMFDWSTKPSNKNNGGYLEWKPICYTKTDRDRLSGTFVAYYSETNAKEQGGLLEESIAYTYFGNVLFTTKYSKSATNISFGLSKDGFYTKTNYTVWSGSIGYGHPPKDAISILVIGVISAGLGLPVILILFGGVFVCVKKHMKKKDQVMSDLTASYSQINST
ncbi:hypothetical protein LOTGIDRAFT_118279 [Lottia gigantea]|uniref:Uncharacterized protein n=1 Tax=Lottia gigantea TaxID=225164 RepID=V3ZSQ5_LOTGI|nr:hypothetical protein LOTGIDRAFT_118279 [Lottia gigantea]ESO94478.1 hypothetical protein LOTGIDRAFT_118279 [Lottia gigantea]